MIWHNLTVAQTAQLLNSDPKNGLSQSDALSRLKENGENKLDEKKPPSFLSRFAAQFNDFMIIILLAAAAVSFALSLIRGETDFADPVIILVIVVLNALLGVIQESRAEKALEALKKVSAPTAAVIRGGKMCTIPASHVVTGDLLYLHAGDLIAADARLVTCENLQTDESSLTGESTPVSKDCQSTLAPSTPLADRSNLVLSSSSVLSGHATAIAVRTGMQTEVGRIADMIMSVQSEQTPLQKKLSDVGKVLGISALLICALVFVLGIFRSVAPFEMFMTSVSLAVAAIPEGLAAIVTIMLAIGVQRMARKNAIIRSLPSVETLGSASVICSDKTGTLTQNKMKVTRIESNDDILTLTLAALCCNCTSDDNTLGASPTERAIITAAENSGLSKSALDKAYPRLFEIPFDSNRKLMSTANRYEKSRRMITKGAPDILISRCTHYFDGKNRIPLDSAKRAQIIAANADMANKALRVIAVGFRDLGESEKPAEANLTFVGLIGMIDPPRPEAVSAVAVCKKAGIRPVMITGDHVLTAAAIAREIGIMDEKSKSMTGAELDRLSQAQLEKTIKNYSVFARVTPEHKVRIVKAWKAVGETVAMTGDGINDAPALKAADIGCAMGITGTDVAKGAADMILTDDNFATIVEAVRQGRGIYANIKKAVQFLLSSNIGEILTVFAGLMLNRASPLAAIQLLWVNLVTDSLPAIALGLDPVDKFAMQLPPHSPRKGLFADGLGGIIVLEGFMIGALALVAFSVGASIYDGYGHEMLTGRTMAFCVLSLSQLVHAFNMRSEHSLFSVGIFTNKYLVGAFLAGVLLQASVVNTTFAAAVFKVVPLNAEQWLIVAFLSFLPLAIVELSKRFQK